jgi:hypothetical protein
MITVGVTITVGETAAVAGTARLLLRVGSEEDMDGCVRDSLKGGWTGAGERTAIKGV